MHESNGIEQSTDTRIKNIIHFMRTFLFGQTYFSNFSLSIRSLCNINTDIEFARLRSDYI